LDFGGTSVGLKKNCRSLRSFIGGGTQGDRRCGR
jgi:hypothetical protein